eukprot:Gb_14047 [translate_table: standard]
MDLYDRWSVLHTIFVVALVLSTWHVLPINSTQALDCPKAIFSFGDSLTDTGNAVSNKPFTSSTQRAQQHPYGITFFGHPSNRFSDGRLLIDFIAQAFGFPFLAPYLGSIVPDYTHGTNFAYASAEGRDDVSNPVVNNLPVQIKQFEYFKKNVIAKSSGSEFQKMNLLLPSPEAFSTAMYFIFIGINDFFHAYTLHQSMTPSHANQTIVPSLLEYVSDAIQGLFALGARTFVIVNVPPLGCTPDMLSLALTRNMTGHDSAGCLISVNSVIQNYNHLLLQKLQSMAQNPSFRGTIELYDSYQTYYDVVHNPEMHGFASSSITKCCYDKHNVCSDPSKHIHWDGIHFTDAFNKQMLKSFLTGPPASRTSHKISASTSTHSTLADVCSLHLGRL